MALLCAVLSAVRQSAVSARLQGIFLVVATACILSFLGEPVFACIDQTVQALRQNGGFDMVLITKDGQVLYTPGLADRLTEVEGIGYAYACIES